MQNSQNPRMGSSDIKKSQVSCQHSLEVLVILTLVFFEFDGIVVSKKYNYSPPGYLAGTNSAIVGPYKIFKVFLF